MTLNKLTQAFCAGAWSERNRGRGGYFGTGESFVFSISPTFVSAAMQLCAFFTSYHRNTLEHSPHLNNFEFNQFEIQKARIG